MEAWNLKKQQAKFVWIWLRSSFFCYSCFALALNLPKKIWPRGKAVSWRFIELGDRRGNWKQFRWTIFCSTLCEDRPYVFEFQRPDILNMYKTIPNLLRGKWITNFLI
jgi:hypothetical protein